VKPEHSAPWQWMWRLSRRVGRVHGWIRGWHHTWRCIVVCLALLMPSLTSARSTVLEVLQTSPVAGFQHYAGPVLFAFMQVGDPLALAREADNPYDPRAVRVFWQGVQIGHAPRVDNIDLARLMDAGVRVEARILHLQKSRDPWKRVLMEVVLLPD